MQLWTTFSNNLYVGKKPIKKSKSTKNLASKLLSFEVYVGLPEHYCSCNVQLDCERIPAMLLVLCYPKQSKAMLTYVLVSEL